MNKRLLFLLICLAAITMTTAQLSVSQIKGSRLTRGHRLYKGPGRNIVQVDIPNHRDYYLLGQYVIGDDVDIANVTLPIAKKQPNRFYLRHPTNFKLLSTDKSGRLRFWKMTCPVSFEAMSEIATFDDVTPPDVTHYACVDQIFTDPRQMQYFDIIKKDADWSHQIWNFVSYNNKPSFYFLFNETTPTSGDDEDGSALQRIDDDPKFGITLRTKDSYDTEAITGRSFKPRIGVVSVDVSDDVYRRTSNKKKNDVTTTSLIVAASIFAMVGIATYWIKQRNTRGSDTNSLASDKTSVIPQASTSSLHHQRQPCHNINISYTVDADEDVPMTSQTRNTSTSEAPAVVNPYMDGSVEGLPSFNDVTSYHGETR